MSFCVGVASRVDVLCVGPRVILCIGVAALGVGDSVLCLGVGGLCW